MYYSFNYSYNANQIIVTINCLKKHFLVVYPDYVPIPIAAAEPGYGFWLGLPVPLGYFIHEYYNLAEICGWIPVQSKNIRTAQNYLWADAQAGESYFKDHVVDAQGFLQSYVDEVWNAKIINTWQCGSCTSGMSK